MVLKTFTKQELYDLLVDYELEDPWIRLKELEDNMKYFNLGYTTANNLYFCCLIGGNVVGCLKLKVGGGDSCNYPGWNNWIGYVSVHKDYHGRGIGKKLIKRVFAYAKISKLKILMSGYSVRGWLHLRDYITCTARGCGVEIKDEATGPSFFDFDTFEGYDEFEYKGMSDRRNKL